MSEMKFRVNYGPQVKRVAIKQPSSNPQGRTKQSFKDECDINNIVKKFNKTGQLPEMIKQNPQYGDYSSGMDYQEACNLVIKADQQFQALPARVRERFNNDAKQFLIFATNPQNGLEMAKMDLLTPEAKERVLKASQAQGDPAEGGAQPGKKGEEAKK